MKFHSSLKPSPFNKDHTHTHIHTQKHKKVKILGFFFFLILMLMAGVCSALVLQSVNYLSFKFAFD